MDDWAGDQMRKEDQEQGVVDQALVPYPRSAAVHQIGDLGKGEEADAQWQQQVEAGELAAGQRVECLDHEVGVLEVNETGDIQQDADQQLHLAVSGGAFCGHYQA